VASPLGPGRHDLATVSLRLSDRLLGTKDLFEHAEHTHNARIGEPIMQGLGLAAEENESVAAQFGQMLR